MPTITPLSQPMLLRLAVHIDLALPPDIFEVIAWMAEREGVSPERMIIDSVISDVEHFAHRVHSRAQPAGRARRH